MKFAKDPNDPNDPTNPNDPIQRRFALLAQDFAAHLYEPLEDFFSRPSKGFRRELVSLGFRAVRPDLPAPEEARLLDAAADAIEALHAGSLIVDDIEDASTVRRGRPTLHLKYGVPRALNAGNWLYFYALRLIRLARPADTLRLALYDAIEDTLVEAHSGQALDIGTRIGGESDPRRIIELSRACLSMKSGALTRLALEMGARIGGASGAQVTELRELGAKTGLCLQMFDDLGNMNLARPTPKHLEDLALERPSFIWWCLAEDFPDYLEQFRTAVRALPSTEELGALAAAIPLEAQGRAKAFAVRDDILEGWRASVTLNPDSRPAFQTLLERISHAYR